MKLTRIFLWNIKKPGLAHFLYTRKPNCSCFTSQCLKHLAVGYCGEVRAGWGLSWWFPSSSHNWIPLVQELVPKQMLQWYNWSNIPIVNTRFCLLWSRSCTHSTKRAKNSRVYRYLVINQEIEKKCPEVKCFCSHLWMLYWLTPKAWEHLTLWFSFHDSLQDHKVRWVSVSGHVHICFMSKMWTEMCNSFLFRETINVVQKF